MDNIDLWIMRAEVIGVSQTAVTFNDQNGRVVCMPNEIVDLLYQRLNDSREEKLVGKGRVPEVSQKSSNHQEILANLEGILAELRTMPEKGSHLKLVVDNT